MISWSEKRESSMAALDDKVVIVTGAGRGIGLAIAKGCAAEGARVVVADYGLAMDGSAPDPTIAQNAAALLRKAGGEAIGISANVARKNGADAIIGVAQEEWGRIDGLVNCAGVLRHRPFLELTEADFDAVIASHLKGHFLMFQGVMVQMVKQGGGGSLIGISSGYVMGDPNRTPYRAAKAGIVGLTKSVAMAGAEHGVRANVIAPIAETRMTHASQLPIAWSPDDIAPMAAFLLSDAADAISGEVYSVHGNTISIWADAFEQRRINSEARWTQAGIAAQIGELRAQATRQFPPVPPVPGTAMPQAEPEV
jgi:NAD(P)-dependent dehydrogenase (short-subunit alcohol dehydrogenase family)